MSRQILTFVIVFVGILLVMRTCAAKPPDATAVLTEKVEAPGETLQLGPVAVAPDGSIVAVVEGEKPVVRTVPPWRRPLRFLVRRRGQENPVAPPADAWESSEVENGRRFRCAWEGLTIEKTVRLVEAGLDVELSVTGAHADVTGFLLTVGSGVPLSDGQDAGPAFALWQMDDENPVKRSFRSLAEKRKSDPKRVFADRCLLGPDEAVRRFGVLGADYFFGFEDLPAADELFLDAYRADRDGTRSDEIEAWVTLVPSEGGYADTFRYRWRPRTEMLDTLGLGDTVRESHDYTIENDAFRAVFTDRDAAIVEMSLKEFATAAGEEPSPGTWVPILRPCVREGERALTLQLVEPESDIAGQIWEVVEKSDASIRFRLVTASNWTVTKTVTLPGAGAYDLGVDIDIRRPADSNASRTRFTIVGPAGSYIEDAFRGTFAAAPPAGFVLERAGGSNENQALPSLVEGEEIRQTYGGVRGGLFLAVGARGAYFTVALVSTDDRNRVTQSVARGLELAKDVERGNGESSRDSILGRVSCQLPLEGGRAQESFRLYAGPNRRETLRKLEIEDAVDFGWFAPIGRFLMWLMKVLQGLVGSYGVAILLMTLIVRACLLPVSYRTQLGMQRYSRKLQKIKPILDELQKKYANNTQKMNQERMKVMREHNIGFPLGCLMILFQFPIWISLFTALRVEFSLRHQPFLWATDLSLPDRLFGLPFWPHYFNLFPIVMLVLWTAQQRLTPTPAGDDPQVRMQMKMMKFMPFLFFFMLYNYASALAVYMCMSSLWSIVESKLVRRAIARMD